MEGRASQHTTLMLRTSAPDITIQACIKPVVPKPVVPNIDMLVASTGHRPGGGVGRAGSRPGGVGGRDHGKGMRRPRAVTLAWLICKCVESAGAYGLKAHDRKKRSAATRHFVWLLTETVHLFFMSLSLRNCIEVLEAARMSAPRENLVVDGAGVNDEFCLRGVRPFATLCARILRCRRTDQGNRTSRVVGCVELMKILTHP